MFYVEMFKHNWSKNTYKTYIKRTTATNNYYIHCAVCGEEFYIQRDSSMTFICPKCAKAVLKTRSMMTEEELNG